MTPYITVQRVWSANRITGPGTETLRGNRRSGGYGKQNGHKVLHFKVVGGCTRYLKDLVLIRIKQSERVKQEKSRKALCTYTCIMSSSESNVFQSLSRVSFAS